MTATEPHRMRITTGGSVASYTKFAVNFLRVGTLLARRLEPAILHPSSWVLYDLRQVARCYLASSSPNLPLFHSHTRDCCAKPDL